MGLHLGGVWDAAGRHGATFGRILAVCLGFPPFLTRTGTYRVSVWDRHCVARTLVLAVALASADLTQRVCP